jgi:dGTPase
MARQGRKPRAKAAKPRSRPLRPLYTEKDWSRRLPLSDGNESGEQRSPARRDYGRLIHCPSFRRLAGKTQLFPGVESDFFRNRLTHSLEVAQVARGIASIINSSDPYFSKQPVDVDVIEFAGLAHDIGHPPFGHNGEKALNNCMAEYGGFEGNAQTLRIIARLEKREREDISGYGITTRGKDARLGLNTCYRSMAAVLKYDACIGGMRNKVEKGYYLTDEAIVDEVKKMVCPDLPEGRRFKTVECAIMDLADDIAYSTYDFEDSMKGGFLHPLDIIAADRDVCTEIAKEVRRRAEKFYPADRSKWEKFSDTDVRRILENLFSDLMAAVRTEAAAKERSEAAALYAASRELAHNGYLRVKVSSRFLKRFMKGVRWEVDYEFPQLSQVYFELDAFFEVEVLKTFSYYSIIMSPMLKMSEFRGRDIVKEVFDAFSSDEEAQLLLPDDHRALIKRLRSQGEKKRVICDFIAGMTDRYAMEVYGRLFSTTPPSMFKPH